MESAWAEALRSSKSYAWPLFKVLLLMGLLCSPAGLLLGITQASNLANGVDKAKAEIIFRVIFYLTIFLSATAFPIVAVENLGAIAALKRSWKMTRRHFFYTAGCYLIPFIVEWLIRWITVSPLLPIHQETSWMGMSKNMAVDVVGSAWIILIWCVYQRTKAVEIEETTAAVIPVNESRPGSPSGA